MNNYWANSDQYIIMSKKVQWLNGLELIQKVNMLGSNNVLDVGCGTGDLLIHLAPMYPKCKFVGIDLSDDMLTTARNHSDYLGLRNIEFVQSNAESMHFLQNKFDVIFSNASFHWFSRDIVLEKLILSLNTNGIFAIHTAGIEKNVAELLDKEEKEFLKIIKDAGLMHKYANYILFKNRRLTPVQLKDLVTKYRLEVLDYGLVLRGMHFTNIDEYLSWLKCSGDLWFTPLSYNDRLLVKRKLIEKLSGENNKDYISFHASSFCIAKKIQEGELYGSK